MKYLKISNALILTAAVLFFSCTKSKTNNEPAPKPAPETFSVFNTWTCANSDLPTQNYRNTYKDMVFTVREDMTYSWKWNKKDGSITEFTGYVTLEKTTFKHSNGTEIWKIWINVTHINGSPAPGGWYGIYASNDVKSMSLNVEPNVSGTTKFPQPSEGIGSGQNGNNAVYLFKR